MHFNDVDSIKTEATKSLIAREPKCFPRLISNLLKFRQMTVDLSYRVDFAWVGLWSKAFYLYKHLVTWATVHCDRRGLKWEFWSRLHPVRNWKNGQAWSVSKIHLVLKVGRAYLGGTWWLLAQRGHEGHPTNCPELLEHGHNPGMAAPKKKENKKWPQSWGGCTSLRLAEACCPTGPQRPGQPIYLISLYIGYCL